MLKINHYLNDDRDTQIEITERDTNDDRDTENINEDQDTGTSLQRGRLGDRGDK